LSVGFIVILVDLVVSVFVIEKILLGVPISQGRVARALVSTEQWLDDTLAFIDDIDSDEPMIAARLRIVHDTCMTRLLALFEQIEGLDGVGFSTLGATMIERLSGASGRLSLDVDDVFAAVADCSQIGLLESEQSRDAARAIILEKIPSRV
jgi:hypothetical protein